MTPEPAFELPFQILILAQLMAFGGIRGYFQSRTKKLNPNLNIDRSWNHVIKQDLWGVMWIFSLFLWVAGLFFYSVWPPLMSWGTLQLWVWIRWIGVGLGIISLLLLLWIHKVLGKSFISTLHVAENHKLVKNGPYRWVRHPMYASGFILMLGTSLTVDNWALLITTGLTLLFIYERINQEEKMLIAHFGDEYRSYKLQTGRLFPRIQNKDKIKA